ncbi:MAG TPA: Sb-PDE family phosphodiesterase [Acidobacteriota bacterium]|nr:Sb-PDE family phosphodiesterase [Acidobacteriota bacterium]
MKKQTYFLWFLVLVLMSAMPVGGQIIPARSPINIPDIPGYLTLKCDFHTHTVFSDGNVWPSVRAEEAWREGLDAIAITDHIEYQPHKNDIPTNHSRSFEIAKQHGDALGITIIRGSEITRKMPPGHINAIFLKSNPPLDTEDWRDAVRIAAEQGAFIFWNHPGWTGQQVDSLARWYPEHSELLEKGLIHGIEVVNDTSYYPEVHRWCLEKNLTMLGNSDIHDPIGMRFDATLGQRRAVTLVFAKENTPEAIQEALKARRTAVLFKGNLIGRAEYLEPIFKASVKVLNPAVTVRGRGSAYIQIKNTSDINYELENSAQFEEVDFPDRLTLVAGKTVLLRARGKQLETTGKKTFELNYTVKNLKLTPEERLKVVIPVEITFVPAQ